MINGDKLKVEETVKIDEPVANDSVEKVTEKNNKEEFIEEATEVESESEDVKVAENPVENNVEVNSSVRAEKLEAASEDYLEGN